MRLKRGELTRLAKEAGVTVSTMRYRLSPIKRKAQIKKSYLKNRTKRIIEMRDYYEENKENWKEYSKNRKPIPYDKKKAHEIYLKRKENGYYN